MRSPTFRIVSALMFVCAAMLVAGCGSSGDSSSSSGGGGGDESIVFETFGGRFDNPLKKFYADPTTEKTGLEIAFDSPTDYSKLRTQVNTGNVQWSVVMGDPFYAIENCESLLEPIKDVVDRSDLDPKYIVSDCSVPGDQFSYTMMYDKEEYGSNPPTSWEDFFDTEGFPGQRAVFAGYVFNGMLEAATLAEGTAPEDVYPIDIDKAIEKLETIKSETDYFETLAAGQQLMEAGEVSMIVLPQENGMYAEENGADFAPVWNQQVTSWNDYFVPKGADVEQAAKLLETIASAEAQNGLSGNDPVGNSLIDPEPANQTPLVEEWSPLVDNRYKGQFTVDQQWWAENLEEAEAKWTAFVSG